MSTEPVKATTKTIRCQPGDRATRDAMRTAHDEGRHGDGTRADVVSYWATICLDCNAVHRYQYATATKVGV